MKRGSLEIKYTAEQYCEDLPLLVKHVNTGRILIHHYNLAYNRLETEIRYIDYTNNLGGSILLAGYWYQLCHYSINDRRYRGRVTLSGNEVINKLKDRSYVIVHKQ